MKMYHTVATPEARDDLRRYVSYVKNVKKNLQAARSIVDDFEEVRKSLEILAGTIGEPDSQKLRDLRLKRINFKKHDYFLLFMVEGDIAKITNMFYAGEDFEKKLR